MKPWQIYWIHKIWLTFHWLFNEKSKSTRPRRPKRIYFYGIPTWIGLRNRNILYQKGAIKNILRIMRDKHTVFHILYVDGTSETVLCAYLCINWLDNSLTVLLHLICLPSLKHSMILNLVDLVDYKSLESYNQKYTQIGNQIDSQNGNHHHLEWILVQMNFLNLLLMRFETHVTCIAYGLQFYHIEYGLWMVTHIGYMI